MRTCPIQFPACCTPPPPTARRRAQVSDGIVTAAFLRQAKNFGRFEECTFSRNASLAFAALSFMLIFTPLVLTAVFIARTQMREYVRRRLSEAQRGVARSGSGALGGLGPRDSGDSGALPLRREQGDWGGGASQAGARTPPLPASAPVSRIHAVVRHPHVSH